MMRPTSLQPTPYNASMYTLDTIDYHDDEEHDRHSDTSPLLSPATPNSIPRPSSAKIIFNATLKMACIFIISSIFLGGTLWLALPTLEESVFFLFFHPTPN